MLAETEEEMGVGVLVWCVLLFVAKIPNFKDRNSRQKQTPVLSNFISPPAQSLQPLASPLARSSTSIPSSPSSSRQDSIW